MELKEKFEAAVANSTSLSEKPSNDILLKIYSLFKQATEGDISGDRPSGFDFKGAAKFDAWKKIEGKDKDECMQEYIDLIDSLN